MAKETTEMKFTKEQWASSEKFKYMPDLIDAVIDDDKPYTEKQVEKMLAEYLKKEVK